ncbi:hypothetical protein [Pedobacter caeni]|uniref:Uncharacterized protein n=1 Tax=Pedobacter caeni TaxID=288992 RepID=A0A1M5M333_9SPHI|nr:hypothetical protein [Pedobacter caeni]SHG71732.1 hypothetical protein SAMN04488522_10749 [Pedobacter caeni]
MKNLKDWFKTKKIRLEDCSSFEMDKEQSDQFFGGFKEYKPPIYEHESPGKTQITISDLFMETNLNTLK